MAGEGFPVYLDLGFTSVHPHPLFEAFAYLLGFQAYRALRATWGDTHSGDVRWWLVAAAAVGAALGSKLLYWLTDPPKLFAAGADVDAWLGGKTIVGGLIGGWLAVELAKKRLGVNSSTGDLYAIPLAMGIMIGRLGCLLTGIEDETHGLPTSLPWAMDVGDGIPRHPTAYYEILFLFILLLGLLALRRQGHAQGDLFRVFTTGYFGFRFLIESMKPGVAWLGLTTLQWASAAVVLYQARYALRRMRAVEGAAPVA